MFSGGSGDLGVLTPLMDFRKVRIPGHFLSQRTSKCSFSFKLTAIFLNGSKWPFCGDASGRVCTYGLRTRFFSFFFLCQNIQNKMELARGGFVTLSLSR